MRLLFLSNYYPPTHNGGYEQLCEEVAGEFTRRGHRIAVLTAGDHDGTRVIEEKGVQVRRLLHLEVEGGVGRTALRLLRDRERLERENLDQLRAAVESFRPDAILVWGMWNVPRSVPALAEQLMPGRVFYYICDYWPSLPSAYLQQFQEPSTRSLTRWPKRILGGPFVAELTREKPVPLKLERPICVSRAVRDLLGRSGVPVSHAEVIYNGIDIGNFPPTRMDEQRAEWGGLRFLYAGRLSPEKGVATAIRALATLRVDRQATLDIVGSGDGSYVRTLKALTGELRLDGRVAFRGSVPREEMGVVLAEHDALLFPSEWEEPMARTVMEAMAVGLVVAGTTTGGTGELLVEGETGLTFQAGDSNGLASQIERLLNDRALGQRLVVAARRRIEENFTFQRMVDELEGVLEEA